MKASTGYSEYTGQMDGKVFALYHYFLSAVILFYQFQPTTSTLAQLFFAPPHAFTLWTVYLVYAKDGMKEA